MRADGAEQATDADGRFALLLAAGHRKLMVSASGYASKETDVSVVVGMPAIEIRLEAERRFYERVDVRATVAPEQEGVAILPVAPTTVLSVAGGAENVFRVLQTLPGVAGTDDFSSRLSVRGGGPDQNLTVMDGVEIHNPYRLFGLASAFNPETVDGFELTTGAFSARYGDRLSSILVVDNRDGSTLAAPSTGSAGAQPHRRQRDPGGPAAEDARLLARHGPPHLLRPRRRALHGPRACPPSTTCREAASSTWAAGRTLTLFGLPAARAPTPPSTSRTRQPRARSTRARATTCSRPASTARSAAAASARTLAPPTRTPDDFDFDGRFRDGRGARTRPDETGFDTADRLTWDGAVRDRACARSSSWRSAPDTSSRPASRCTACARASASRSPADATSTEATASSLGGAA